MDKLFMYFILGSLLFAAIKVISFYLYQRLLNPKTKPNKHHQELVRLQSSKVSNTFNTLLKARVLTRDDILIIRKMLIKYSVSNRKYKNDCELIYSVLKHGNIRLNELGSLEVFLESKRQKIKC